MYVKQKIREEISIQHSIYLFYQISLQMQYGKFINILE